MSTQTWWETVGGTGGAVLDQLKKLLAAGNVRRVRGASEGRDHRGVPADGGAGRRRVRAAAGPPSAP